MLKQSWLDQYYRRAYAASSLAMLAPTPADQNPPFPHNQSIRKANGFLSKLFT
jgi:hypothetical protein